MFQQGDLVVYGTTGVCRVEEITRLDLSEASRDRLYYRLMPLQQDGVIYTPVDGNGKIPIRPVITAEEAEELIDRIPDIQVEAYHSSTLQALTQHYQEVMRTHNCGDILELLRSIYVKRQQVEAQKRRLGMVDERFMKQAERMLYGEFSAALGIPFDEVQPYIRQRVERLQAADDSAEIPAI